MGRKLTTKALRELGALKMSDHDRFLDLVEEMAVDILLNYKKFKEYPANI